MFAGIVGLALGFIVVLIILAIVTVGLVGWGITKLLG